jgi:hypothetical protein
MSALRNVSWLVLASVLLFALSSTEAHAQQGGGRGWGRLFQIPAVTLAQLESVQKELKLSDEQTKQVAELNERLNEDRRELFQGGAGGDRSQFREKWTKLNADAAEAFNEILDDAQSARAQEIYVQVNGPSVVLDEQVAADLKLSDEQKKQLEEVISASREEFMGAGLGDMEREAAAKKMEELTAGRDEKLLAVLNDDQRAQFEKMQGEKVEIDLSELPRPGRS